MLEFECTAQLQKVNFYCLNVGRMIAVHIPSTNGEFKLKETNSFGLAAGTRLTQGYRPEGVVGVSAVRDDR